MSKQAITTQYVPTFTPGAAGVGTVSFSTLNGFALGGLYAIWNQTRNVLIYAATVTGYGYTAFNAGSSTITLQQDTSSMSAGDALMVLMDTVDIGTAYDTVASSDTGFFSLIALTKRIASKLPLVGAANALSSALSLAVAPSAELVTGPALQTAVTNNLLSSISAANDCLAYRTVGLQITPAGTITAGTIVFEASNDNVTFTAVPLYDITSLTAAPVTTYTLATGVTRMFVASLPYRYFRVRLSAAVTGTAASVQAFATFSTLPFHPLSQQIQNATAANVQATVTATNLSTNVAQIAATAAAALTSAAAAAKGLGVMAIAAAQNADKASAAVTTTSNSGTIAADFGSSLSALINVTAFSGTNPTLDIALQESFDNGTTWQDIYHVPRIITGTITYTVPAIAIGGRRRWSYTLGGTTPSFTFSITAMQGQGSPVIVRHFYDRTINPNVAGNTSASFNCEGCQSITLAFNSGAVTTTPCAVRLQFSNDGSNWYSASAALTTVAGSTVAIASTQGVQGKFCRAVVDTQGTGQTLNFVEFFGTN